MRIKPWILATLMLAALFACASAETIVFAPDDMPFSQDAIRLRVDYVYAGTHDCLLVRSGGKSMLVDGGTWTNVPYLEAFFAQEGVTGFDYMLNTHCHDDHIQGLIKLVRRHYAVGEYLAPYPDNYNDTEGYQDIMRAELAKKDIPYRQIASEDVIELGDATITVLRDERKLSDKNMHSAMLSVVCGERSVLLTADVGNPAQQYLAEKYADKLRADILKAPHHGIMYIDQTFLETVNPALCMASRRSKDCIALNAQLAARGIPALYGSQGTISLVTDGTLWYAYQLPVPLPKL